MAAEAGQGQAERVTRKKNYEPDDDKDYRLCCIRIEDAENGVVVKCEYELRPEIKEKMRANKQDVPWRGMDENTESYVFEDKAGAMKFLTDELNELFADGEEPQDDEEGE